MVIYMLIIIWEVVICIDDEMNEGDLPSPRTMGTQSQTTCTVLARHTSTTPRFTAVPDLLEEVYVDARHTTKSL